MRRASEPPTAIIAVLDTEASKRRRRHKCPDEAGLPAGETLEHRTYLAASTITMPVAACVRTATSTP
jgi:hypothetical protein